MSMAEATAGAAFAYRSGSLHGESVDLAQVAARFGTPTYVYSRQAILAAYGRYASALAGRRALVCYAVKANSNLAVLDLLARAGCGFDIVSGGELERVLTAGADPAGIVFSGVGKTAAEMAAALRAGIACFNLESCAEIDALDRTARTIGRRAPFALRINPDVDAQTHPYIATGLRANKFGIPADQAVVLYERAAACSGLAPVGIDCHIGSQITGVAPYIEAAERVLDLVDRIEARGIQLDHLDLGGGLGIAYGNECAPAIEDLVAALLACIDRRGYRNKRLVLEPGRSIVGPAGVLLTRVQLLKTGAAKDFAIVDAAMNDLLRPALYDAWMEVVPVRPRVGTPRLWDLVGPVCESADWLARDRLLDLQSDDLLAILAAGAYGMSMASNYNSRGRPAEVLVDDTRMHLVRRRETAADLYAAETRFHDDR